MRAHTLLAVLLCNVVWLTACTLPAGSGPQARSTAVGTAGSRDPAVFPSASENPRATRVPFVVPSGPTRPQRATPDARVQWPPDVPAFLPPGAHVVDASEVDTDGDGVTGMLVIYSVDGIGRGLVIRRELPGGRAYTLGGGAPADLFRERWGANIVDDVNGDGKTEIVVEGTVSGSAETVNVFQWNGSAYVSLLALSGTEGVAVDDLQKNGVLEFTALQLVFQRSAVMQGTHAAWRDGAYRQWGDVRFLLGPPLRFNYPEEAALAYYGYWSQGQPEKMYGLLAEPQRSATTLEMLAEQTRAVESVTVANLSVADEQEASATVTLEARMTARATKTETTMKHTWRLEKADGQWQMAELQQP